MLEDVVRSTSKRIIWIGKQGWISEGFCGRGPPHHRRVSRNKEGGQRSPSHFPAQPVRRGQADGAQRDGFEVCGGRGHAGGPRPGLRRPQEGGRERCPTVRSCPHEDDDLLGRGVPAHGPGRDGHDSEGIRGGGDQNARDRHGQGRAVQVGRDGDHWHGDQEGVSTHRDGSGQDQRVVQIHRAAGGYQDLPDVHRR